MSAAPEALALPRPGAPVRVLALDEPPSPRLRLSADSGPRAQKCPLGLTPSCHRLKSLTPFVNQGTPNVPSANDALGPGMAPFSPRSQPMHGTTLRPQVSSAYCFPPGHLLGGPEPKQAPPLKGGPRGQTGSSPSEVAQARFGGRGGVGSAAGHGTEACRKLGSFQTAAVA